MKTLIILLFNIILAFPVIAQVSDEGFPKTDTNGTVINNNYSNTYQKSYIKKHFASTENMHFSFQTGASVMSFGNSSVFSTYVAPQLNFSLTPKLNITVGTIALNSNFNNMMYYNYNEGTTSTVPNSTQMFIYLQGDYQVNNRIKIRGTTFREITNSSNPNNNPFSFNQIGVDFKISDNIFMSADFIQSSGRPPTGLNGINYPMFRSNYPFGGGFNNYGW